MNEAISSVWEVISTNPREVVTDAIKLAIGALILVGIRWLSVNVIKSMSVWALKNFIINPVKLFIPKKPDPVPVPKELTMEEKFSTDYCNMIYSLDDQFASWNEGENTLYGAGIQVEVSNLNKELKCVMVGGELVNILPDMTSVEKTHFGDFIKKRIEEIKERDRLRRREKAGYGLQTAKCGVAVSYPQLTYKDVCKGK